MKLNISKKYPIEFVISLKSIAKELLDANINKERCKYYLENENINVYKVFLEVINSLHLTQTTSEWILYVNPVQKYKGQNLSKLLNKITYGTLSLKGYPLLQEIFENITKNIFVYYTRWENGN